MYLLIRHELSRETEAKRGEVAEAKAGYRQRDAQLRSKSARHQKNLTTPRALSHTQTQAKARAKDIGHRWGHISQWLHERATER
jgi:hypothetical protein